MSRRRPHEEDDGYGMYIFLLKVTNLRISAVVICVLCCNAVFFCEFSFHHIKEINLVVYLINYINIRKNV